MELKAGKFYRTRGGQKVGPMSDSGDTAFDTDERILSGVVSGSDRLYRKMTGQHLFCNEELDIVSEWSDGPVRTVTRREIVPGSYGCVEVDVYSYGMNVVVDFSGGKCTPEELREAAHILCQVAEALEENK